MRRHSFLTLVALPAFAVLIIACGNNGVPGSGPGPIDKPSGQSSFVTGEPSGDNNNYGGSGGGSADAGAAASDGGGSSSPSQPAPGAPSGRVAEVEEAEIYRFHNDRLYYLNTYKGLVIYDLSNPAQPTRIGRLPIFGYPIEMFFEGNTVVALVKDALYLTQKQGAIRFTRTKASQMVTIDVSDPKAPRIVKRYDIEGQLREGVSRKVENSIYVVSYRPSSYYTGWGRPSSTSSQREMAHVYSYDISDPKNVKQIDKLKLFEGGAYDVQIGGSRATRRFSGVGISATANALMVTENWRVTRYQVNGWSCGWSWWGSEAKVSIIDISDPKGTIRVHTTFTRPGSLTDQFKQTYTYDAKTKKGTYLGIFAVNEWGGCQRNVSNELISVDITDGANPRVLSSVRFGKPNETVRGSVFDLDRKVAFAITARAIDPLYAISFADLNNLKILSEIDGLSGDMSVFRFIGNKQFLMGVGRDNSNACTGFQNQNTWSSTKMAVSIIDVRDLSAIRLVQRGCVAVESGRWQRSSISWNLDQAHKMLGMYSDGPLNIVAVPVTFYEQTHNNFGWWWYTQRSAIGMLQWDLTKYDPTKDHLNQNVLSNLGSVLHPHGEVKRTIFWKRSSGQRLMLTLSLTHIAVTDVTSFSAPKRLSEIELAPYVRGVYKLGKVIVEQLGKGNSYYRPGPTRFRVKSASDTTPFDQRKVLSEITTGPVTAVRPHGSSLLLFSRIPDSTGKYYGSTTRVSVYDFSDPAKPRARGTVDLPKNEYSYWGTYCGSASYWYYYSLNGYGYSRGDWIQAGTGLVKLATTYKYDYSTRKSTTTTSIRHIDLSNLDKPAFHEHPLSTNGREFFEVVPSDEAGRFYLVSREEVGSEKRDGVKFTLYRYYATDIKVSGAKLSAGTKINVPGRLIKTYKRANGQRVMLTSDPQYVLRDGADPSKLQSWQSPAYLYTSRPRLRLLRRVGSKAVLRDSYDFTAWRLYELVLDNERLYLNARRPYDYYSNSGPVDWWKRSDTLMIFDLANDQLDNVFTSELGTPYANLFGVRNDRLFIKIPGEGILVIDTKDPANPKGLGFAPTLGYVTHVAFNGNKALLAAGNYGVFEMSLDKVGAATQIQVAGQ